MKRIAAEFKPRWRPGRLLLAMVCGLAICTAVAVGGAVWEHHRMIVLRAQVAQFVEDEHAGIRPAIAPPIPPYAVSAQQFLRERAAGWAPMLRTLENASMVGVTPTSVEFNAADGSARVELNYSDSMALIDYLGRINEGVSPAQGVARWSLVETRVQPSTGPSNGSIPGMPGNGNPESVALIRSIWLDVASEPRQETGRAGAPSIP